MGSRPVLRWLGAVPLPPTWRGKLRESARDSGHDRPAHGVCYSRLMLSSPRWSAAALGFSTCVVLALLGCDYGGYAPSDRDNCVPCRERLPAAQCPPIDCCRFLSDDPYETTAPEAREAYDTCSAEEKGPYDFGPR